MFVRYRINYILEELISCMNILLLVADSLRAENTSLHGYHRDTTPFLDELADESIVYDTAIAPSIWSLPSHASIWTGLHADEHRLYSTTSALGGIRDCLGTSPVGGILNGCVL